MKILHTNSLIETVDAFNEAVYLKYPWQQEAKPLIAWMDSRLGKDRAYAGSYALTESDWNREFRLFTGEKVSTRAARSHIIAEESTRIMNIIKRETGLDSESRTISEKRLVSQILSYRPDHTLSTGFYCCGKCSISLWRCVAGGGFVNRLNIIEPALSSLAKARDGSGGWHRFPFYYTLFFLKDIDPRLAAPEIQYCSKRLERVRKRMVEKTEMLSKRRIWLVDQLLKNIM